MRSTDGTTLFTKPKCSARSADIGSPVAIISNAMAFGTARGSRNTPPAPATRLRLTSGTPKMALSDTTDRSQASRISNPPASA